MWNQTRLLTVVLVAVCCPGMLALGQEASGKKPNYQEDIAPIFSAQCNACHNNDKKKGGLVLDGYSALMQGGASGAVIEPGDPGNSRLYLLVAHEEEPSMPPSAPKLPDALIEAIRAWIEAGAPESSGSVVAVKAKPKLDFTLDPAAIGKPQGEPAMPVGLFTEPLVTSVRPPAILALAHSPWAPLTAIGGHKQVILYHTQTRRLLGILPFPEGSIEVLRFTPDGGLLLAAGGRGGQSGRVVAWDVKTGERVIEIGKEYDTVLAADISPDRSLVALGGPSKVLRVYHTSDGSLAYECKKHTDWITAAAFSPDGVLLSSGDRNGGLFVWEAATGREFYELRNHSAMITDVAWRADSNLLASSSDDTSIRLWEMQGGTQLKAWNAHGGVASVSLAKDGRLVSSGRDGLVRIWDQAGAQMLQLEGLGDVATEAVFTHDDQAVVTGGFSGEVRIYNVQDGTRLGDLSANPARVSERFQQARAEWEAAQAAATVAAEAQANLQASLDQAAERLQHAQLALKESHAAHEAAQAALVTAESQAAEWDRAWSDADTQMSAAEEMLGRALRLRNEAFDQLRASEAAVEAASAAYAASASERERRVVEQATRHLRGSSERLRAALDAWNAAIEHANACRGKRDQAERARLDLSAQLPVLRLKARQMLSTRLENEQRVAAEERGVEAAQTGLNEKSRAFQAARERAESLKLIVDELVAEKQRLDARQPAAHAAISRP